MKPFTFAEWLNEGKSMNTVVDASHRVPTGIPLAEHLRQGAVAATARAAQASTPRRPAERRPATTGE